MAARAFACYIKDKLGHKSDYLVCHAEAYVMNCDGETVYAYPRGIERKELNSRFDQLFNDLCQNGFFHTRSGLDNLKSSDSSIVDTQSLPGFAVSWETDGQMVLLA